MNLQDRLLPEFFLDKNHGGALASGLLTAITQHGRVWPALAVCAILAICALLFVAMRARRLGADAGTAAAAIALVVLCMSARAGVAFDAAGWFFAALLLLVAGGGERYRWYLPAIVLIWSVMLDSGTIGAALVVAIATGIAIDERAWNARVKRAFAVALACVAASLFSAHGLSLVFGGARALYFDMLLPGADRQPLWSPGFSAAAFGAFAIAAIAAIGGAYRKHHSADVTVFVTTFTAALLDVRMAPFFAIAAAPPVLARYAATLHVPRPAGVVFAALSILAAVHWAPSDMTPAMLQSLRSDRRAHRVVCAKPSWCNSVMDLQADGITALTVGVPAASPSRSRKLQKRIDDDTIEIANEMHDAQADALLASEQTAAPALLLAQGGWHVLARDARSSRVLIVRDALR